MFTDLNLEQIVLYSLIFTFVFWLLNSISNHPEE